MLYLDVHTISYYYHWEEEKILKLPTKKRDMYIRFIKAQIKAENGDDEEEEFDKEDDYYLD